MKTNRILILVALAALFLSYEAQAFYHSSTGRWLSRDPIEEKGGKNIYRFVHNNPIGKFDPEGRKVSDPATACCDTKKRPEGWTILRRRFLNATKFLDDHGVELDPTDVNGVSCAQSANRILAFMSPIPPCWTCYIQRRSWGWNPFAGDENSILCKPNKYCHLTVESPTTFPIAFDWFWQKYEHRKQYVEYPLSIYVTYFPYNLNPPLYAWWDETNPAPHDDCVNKSPFRPEDYNKWLWPLVPTE